MFHYKCCSRLLPFGPVLCRITFGMSGRHSRRLAAGWSTGNAFLFFFLFCLPHFIFSSVATFSQRRSAGIKFVAKERKTLTPLKILKQAGVSESLTLI